MERIRYMVTFAEVVHAGSFVGAADKLGLAPSVVSKHISKLERDLGVKLLHRSTRNLSVTEAGQAFHGHCARILDEIEQSEQSLARLQAEPQGLLRISALASVCNGLVAPMIPGFLERHPKVELEIIASDHVVNLMEEGFDLALRVTTAPDPNLVARKLFSVDFRICGAPAYFAAHGRPESLADLVRHRCLSFPTAPQRRWALWHERRKIDVPVGTQIRINSIDAIRQMALKGTGLALLPTYSVASLVDHGEIEIVLPEYRGIAEADLYAVYLPNRYGSPKVKAFLQFFSAYLRERGLLTGG